MSYNGWKNYETWATALWIDNDQGTQEEAQRLTRDAWESPDPNKYKYLTIKQQRRFALAYMLEDWVTQEMLPDLGASLASDLLQAAVSEIDWNEIADRYLSDIQDEPENDDDAEAATE